MSERNGFVRHQSSPSGRRRLPARVWGAVRLLVLVPLARLRFLFVLGAIGAVIVKWDELAAHFEKWTRSAAAADVAAVEVEFFCPMHPSVVRDTNREKCPVCFMPLARRKKGEASDDALPPGAVSRVQLSPYRVVLAGVRTAPVAYRPLVKEVATVGTVEFDERRLRTVSARVRGRIETLFVNQTGQQVRAGDPLAELYSPDLVVTAQNLLDARTAGNRGLEATARERLRRWGLADAEIDAAVQAGRPAVRVTVRSPIGGHVTRKYPKEGQYVEEGTPLFDVADLSTVWVQAQLYEDDLAVLPPGSHHPETGKPAAPLAVTAAARAFPDRPFAGTLAFLFPHVDPETRTLTARFDVPNPGHELRPGMTATVTLRLTPGQLAGTPAGAGLGVRNGTDVLSVPEPAVVDTGRQKVVYRETLPHTFDGVLVELGPRMAGPDGGTYYPVRAGLADGDRVVTAGAFLVDAETRLNPALGSVYVGGSGGGGKSGGPTVRPTTPEDEDAKVAAALAKLSPEDRRLAAAQYTCPVLEGSRLGSMDVPLKLTLDGKPVFVCCKQCVKGAQADPAKTAARAEALRSKGAPAAPPPPDSPSQTGPVAWPTAEEWDEIRSGLARLPAEDRKLAEAQRWCPVLAGSWLGSMGPPVKLTLDGKPVFVCCKSCVKKAQADPAKARAGADALTKRAAANPVPDAAPAAGGKP